MSLVVQKFGGTSLADPAGIHRAARRAIRTKLAGQRVVMVVSAMGDSTDRLLELAQAICSEPPKRELDMLLTTGEQVSIALTALAIESAGHEAISLTAAQLGLVTDSAHTRARIQRISRERIDRELAQGRIVIVAGFQGADVSGEITTMGRGASDTTATALASVLGASVCEVYTDVAGVFTADPRLVPNARLIQRLSYEGMLEMAGAGAGVMHPRAIDFAQKAGLRVQVRSARADSEGTTIMAETPDMRALPVSAVALRDDLALVALDGLPYSAAAVAGVFAELAHQQVLVDDIALAGSPGLGGGEPGRAQLRFLVSAADARTVRELCQRQAVPWGVTAAAVDEDVAKVSAVGVGMRAHAGVGQTMFEALATAGIVIRSISTSEIVISCVIPRSEGPRALRVVHDAFGLGEPAPPTGAATATGTGPLRKP